MGFLLYAFLPAIIITLAIVGALVWRGMQFGELARHGLPVTGIVIRKFRTGAGNAGSMGRRIAFSYVAADGVEHRRAATVSGSKWVELEEGGPIQLVYLPEKPGVSAPAWLVEDARKALGKAA
ncbi:hypothetical protein EDC40_105152 [Aminobacter aminovorans]|uniref:DUF3592 domain-containing protein n=1 Tax=Aminobacter aminovorans TaxID=83263 RepID=A0A380WND6_AMIAI|nr:DUF3592 domain-containing protein [Aminobacter aminovorans]TCS25954.1 hypothetical protein EDC40_105152 [Aminobacter aminovorans]SUU90381.1 Uncharacterised protein [Aminobacter aminovorans]